MSEELCFTCAGELVAAYRAHELSPVEVATASLERIEKFNPVLNCFCHLEPDSTLAAARASEERWRRNQPRGLLDGVPVSIKDLLPLRGWPTRMGSRTIDADGPWDDDDPAVARLREHGAVFLGKTNTPEFGNSGITNSPLNGLTVNPWDVTRTTGGSSGGSVAAVAAGMGPISIGTDAGGSIRTPSSFCGLVGLKPSFGRVPQYRDGDWGGLSVSGPITRTATDAALVMNVITGPDPGDPNSLPAEQRDYVAEIDRGLKGRRIAFSTDLGFMPVNPELARMFEQTVGHFEDLGAEIVEATPELGDPVPLFDILWTPNLAYLASMMTPAQRALLGDETRESVEQGEKISLSEYLAAQSKRAELARVMRRFHQDYDLLLTPTAIVSPFSNEHHMPPDWDTERAWLWELPTFCFNFTRQPAITVPCGFTDAGLPVGLQIVAPIYEDSRALQAAHAYQQAYPTTERRPPLKT